MSDEMAKLTALSLHAFLPIRTFLSVLPAPEQYVWYTNTEKNGLILSRILLLLENGKNNGQGNMLYNLRCYKSFLLPNCTFQF